MDGKFISYEIGLVKNDPKFYEYIAEKLEIKLSEMVFFDDSSSKVESARKAGVDAYVYEGFDQFLGKLKELELVE